MEEFKRDCDTFSKVGEDISIIIFGKEGHETQEWNERRFNPGKWFHKNYSDKNFPMEICQFGEKWFS